MIEIKNLVKRYGNKAAVDNLSFTVPKGEILGFLGPNGAGKTTTMNILTGYIASTSGTATIAGYDILEQPIEAKKKIGYLPEQPPLYMDMTVQEYLQFVFELKKTSGNKRKAIDNVLELARIGDVKGRIIKNLSKGYRQRVGLAQALIGSPEVLVLDEPTVGLDPKQIIEIRNVIKDLGKEHTIILSTHILPEVSAICERVIIINKGKIAAIDTPDNLAKRMSHDSRLSVRIVGDQQQVLQTLRNVEGVKHVHTDSMKEPSAYDYIVEAEKDFDIRQPLFFALAQGGMPILHMKNFDMSLEDIFMQLTADGSKALRPEKKKAIAQEKTELEPTEDTIDAEQATKNGGEEDASDL
ncbi:MAG: ATP-binding cassette domain-containing protein [Hyphomonadaceae bacterium]|nr:ATP-binding cassette domain-containing protein [Clostridia bacterium]